MRYAIILNFPWQKWNFEATAMGSKFHFSQSKIHFFHFIFIEKYLKFKEIEYLIHYLKVKM